MVCNPKPQTTRPLNRLPKRKNLLLIISQETLTENLLYLSRQGKSRLKDESNLALILALLLLTCQIISCQPTLAANNTWSYNYIGPTADKTALGLAKTGDGGYVVLAGSTFSDRACWLLKINAYGAVEWNKTIPLYNDDWLSSITPTPDGGFALAGRKDFSSVKNNIPSLNGKGIDFWLIKADKYGNIEWNQTYGGSWHEGADAIVTTSDGGYALAGYTWSFEPNGYWLVKTDSNGTLQWSNSYESTYGANELVQTADGGFSLVGTAAFPSNGSKV